MIKCRQLHSRDFTAYTMSTERNRTFILHLSRRTLTIFIFILALKIVYVWKVLTDISNNVHFILDWKHSPKIKSPNEFLPNYLVSFAINAHIPKQRCTFCSFLSTIIELVGSRNGAMQAIYLSFLFKWFHLLLPLHSNLSSVLESFHFPDAAIFYVRTIKNCLFHFICSHLYHQPSTAQPNIHSHEMTFIGDFRFWMKFFVLSFSTAVVL